MPRNALWWTLPWLLLSVAAHAADAMDAGKPADNKAPTHFVPEQQGSKGSVTVEGRHIDYDAYAGTIVVHPKNWDDVPQNAPKDEDKNPRPEASMFYVAYFKTADKGGTDKGGSDKSSSDKTGVDKGAATRPVTFVFNGGPGS